MPAGILEVAVIGLMGAVGRREEIVQHALAGAKACAPGSRSELRARVADLDQALTVDVAGEERRDHHGFTRSEDVIL